MGSLHNYRIWLRDLGLVETDARKLNDVLQPEDNGQRLSLAGHAVAGESLVFESFHVVWHVKVLCLWFT